MYDNDNLPLEPDPIADAAFEHSSIQGSTPMTKPNEPAYPTPVSMNPRPGEWASATCPPGLTNREAFIKAAMQGLLSRPANHDPQMIARDAVLHADATLAELNKEKGE